MGWPAPVHSRSAIKKAGVRIRRGTPDVEDILVLNDWRAAHGYIINTFQASLRSRAKAGNVPVAQRLKRAATIMDKLEQGRTLDLWTMQDIAGCRLVFPDINSLYEFRASFHTTKAKHELVNGIDKYDYIKKPKGSGYRGIHDIYKYKAGTQSGARWNGLLIEIQYRTAVQHAWATAVELSDVLTSNRTKFSQGSADNERFFQICSELLARSYEATPSCLPFMSHRDLITEWHMLEDRAHLFRQLRNVGEQHVSVSLKGFVLLIADGQGGLQIERGDSYRQAVEKLLELERQFPEKDIVLVSGNREDSLKNAFRNYFQNASEFISLIEDVPGLLPHKGLRAVATGA